MTRFPVLSRRLRRSLSRFCRSERATASIEFVIAVPIMTLMLAHGSEVGTILTRGAMIERGLDIAVRDLRVGPVRPDFEEFRQRMCDVNRTIPDCMNALQVELRPYTDANLAAMTGNPNCIDRSEEIEPVDETTFTPGLPNQTMLVRACAVFEPNYPMFGIGAALPKDDAGNYRIAAISAYVQEP